MDTIQTLHILNKSPDHPRAIQCLAMLSPEDALLLTGNGVLLCVSSKLANAGQVFALSTDLEARGLACPGQSEDSGKGIAVAFADMVSLSLQAQRVISW